MIFICGGQQRNLELVQGFLRPGFELCLDISAGGLVESGVQLTRGRSADASAHGGSPWEGRNDYCTIAARPQGAGKLSYLVHARPHLATDARDPLTSLRGG